MVVASEAAAHDLGLDIMARLIDWQVVGVEPRIMGIGPVPATRQLLERQGLAFGDIDLVELNEAFASQALACLAELPFDQELSIRMAAPSPWGIQSVAPPRGFSSPCCMG